MRFALLTLTLAVAACASDTPLAPVGTQTSGSTSARPATLETNIEFPGDRTRETVALADFPDFPVPFSTYLRDGVTVEQPGSGDAVQFTVHDAGQATVTVMVAADGLSAQQTVDRLRAQAPGETQWTNEGEWFTDSFSFLDGDTYVNVAVGERDGTVYVVEESYLVAESDAFDPGQDFYPTLDVMMSQWQWADGTPFYDRDDPNAG